MVLDARCRYLTNNFYIIDKEYFRVFIYSSSLILPIYSI